MVALRSKLTSAHHFSLPATRGFLIRQRSAIKRRRILFVVRVTMVFLLRLSGVLRYAAYLLGELIATLASRLLLSLYFQE
jgi:hypothetical protein